MSLLRTRNCSIPDMAVICCADCFGGGAVMQLARAYGDPAVAGLQGITSMPAENHRPKTILEQFGCHSEDLIRRSIRRQLNEIGAPPLQLSTISRHASPKWWTETGSLDGLCDLEHSFCRLICNYLIWQEWYRSMDLSWHTRRAIKTSLLATPLWSTCTMATWTPPTMLLSLQAFR